MTTQRATVSGSLLLASVMEPKEIGKRIQAARKRRYWTQAEFAREANVSLSSVTRWEAGALPPVRELIRLADLLGVDPEELVEERPMDDQVAARLAALEVRVAELAPAEMVEAGFAALERAIVQLGEQLSTQGTQRR